MKYSNYNIIIPAENENKYMLFNTLSGHTLSIDHQVAQWVKVKDIDNLPKDTYNLFCKYHIVIPDERNEEYIYSYYFNKDKFSNNGVLATILLTWACNFKCTYCYEGAGEDKHSLMSEKTAQDVVDFIISKSIEQNGKFISIMLFGGEPLLNINTGFYILEKLSIYCKENNKILISGMITNGSLITEEILTELKKYNCQMIQITLDGTRDIHNSRRMYKSGQDSFDKVIESIKLVDKHGEKIRQVIRINVDKINLSSTIDVLKLLKIEGINNSTVDFGIVRGSTAACSSYASNCIDTEELGEVLENLWNKAKEIGFKINTKPSRKWTYCGLYNDNNYTIDPEGNLYKCWEMVGEERHKMGSIGDNGIWKDLSDTFYDWMSHNPLNNEECKACEYLPVCGGGCGVISYNETSNYHSKGCFKTKGVIEKQVLSLFNKQNNEINKMTKTS